jgi:hypothetical protein
MIKIILNNSLGRCCQRCFLSLLLSLFITDCLSQDTAFKNNSSGNYVLFGRFYFKEPDERFELLKDSSGYHSTVLQATIKYITVPGNYTDVTNEFKELKSTEKTLVLEMTTLAIGSRRALSIVQEEIAPTNSGYENYISLCIIIPFNETNTLIVLGTYPKSQDPNLRNKFIEAALTIRER